MTRTISHTELRDGSAGVMAALDAGEEFVITCNGRPIAELRPIAPRRNMTTAELKKRLARFGDTANAAGERAEIDASSGEDRLDG
ncbi:hypothetical protein [Nocardia grenadensis]|uniref:hypothetical protein n=1 Tax=Nocardia grenadensis TaxID=931537 RepID=UPI003D706EEF